MGRYWTLMGKYWGVMGKYWTAMGKYWREMGKYWETGVDIAGIMVVPAMEDNEWVDI